MSIYKDNVTGKWRVVYRYTDWTGKTKQTSKRGFPTKREAQMWEHEQMLKHDAKLDMTFASFYEIYVEDKKERIRDNTWGTKNNIARTKILPYFGERKIAEIEPKDVIAWQNHLLAFKRANGKGYSASYLRKIHSQLSAIFNHAVDFYHLPSNPAQKAGNIAIEEYKEMLFWTKEEYLKFADVMMDKPVSYYAFEMLYWCGIREGELLALTPADFDFTTHTLRINKSYQRLNREDVITPPKKFKSKDTNSTHFTLSLSFPKSKCVYSSLVSTPCFPWAFDSQFTAALTENMGKSNLSIYYAQSNNIKAAKKQIEWNFKGGCKCVEKDKKCFFCWKTESYLLYGVPKLRNVIDDNTTCLCMSYYLRINA